MTEQTAGAAKPCTGPQVAEASCAQPEEVERTEYLDKLKDQIRNGVYRPDVRDLARSLASMIVRSL
jgi:hypothetical protein